MGAVLEVESEEPETKPEPEKNLKQKQTDRAGPSCKKVSIIRYFQYHS